MTLVPVAHSQPASVGNWRPTATPGFRVSPSLSLRASVTHVHPSGLIHRLPPRMQSCSCTYMHGPNLHTCPPHPPTVLFLSSGTRVKKPRDSRWEPHGSTPADCTEIQKAGGEGGVQPQSPGSHLLRGDPASLGCGQQRVSQAVARKPQAVLFQQGSSTVPRHLSARRHQIPTPTATSNRRPAIRVSLAPREARGIRLTPYAQALLGIRGSTRPREHPSPGKVWAPVRLGPAV